MVSGYKDSGKDFVSGELSNSLRFSDIVAFATPMKDILSVMFGISKSDLDKYKNDADSIYIGTEGICDELYDTTEITDFRSIIQRFGSEAMKPIFGKDVWVDLLLKMIKTLDAEYVIVSDWRFINEYEGVNDMFDVVTVRVDDHNLLAGTHDSEHQLDDFQFDYRINNTAKTDDVLQHIHQLASMIELEVI